MKNKIKYLLGFLIIGIGLLFNQSFSEIVYIDTVTTPLLNGGDSANYLYTFNNSCFYNGSSNICWLGYSKYYNGTYQYDISTQVTQDYSCNNIYSGVYFNDSIYLYSGYLGSCSAVWQNVGRFNKYVWNNYVSNGNNQIQVLLGNGTEFGKIFVGVQEAKYELPIYGFAKSFASTNSFTNVLSSSSNYFRLFFNQNVNLSSPLDGFDIVNLSGTNMTGSYGWEYFYPRGTRTNYGYIVDDGQLYNKYKHFGLFDYGYSYSYILGNETYSSMSWDSLKFVTVDDSIYDYQKLFGDVSSTEFYNLSWRGILVLRGNSYVSRGNDNGVYLLSKNPNNYQQILYEHWSCNTSNLDVIFSGGNGTVGSCIKLDGGYLTYNNDTLVMPFTSSSDTINPDSDSLPFVRSIIKGNDLNSSHGYTKVSNNCLYINSDSVCYGFSTNTGVNLYEIYLSENPGHGNNGSGSTDWIGGSSNDSLYLSCLGPVYNTPDGLPPYYCYDENGDFNPDRLIGCFITTDVGSDGELYEHIFCNVDGQQQEVEIIENGSGTSLVPCSGDSCDGRKLEILIGSGDDLSYLYNYFDFKTGFFFKCPFQYSKKLTIFPGLLNLFNGVDIVLPVNCIIAGFEHGKSYDFFDNVNLYGVGPIITGNTQQHKILFRFFDFLLIIGLSLFFLLLRKKLK